MLGLLRGCLQYNPDDRLQLSVALQIMSEALGTRPPPFMDSSHALHDRQFIPPYLPSPLPRAAEFQHSRNRQLEIFQYKYSVSRDIPARNTQSVRICQYKISSQSVRIVQYEVFSQ